MAKTKRKIGISTILLLPLWAIGIDFGLWSLVTGWDKQNAIMAYCSTFNDTSLGWFKYVCGHGVLNFVAGYAAIFFAVSPVLFIISWAVNKWNFNVALKNLFATAISSTFMVGFTTMLIYSGLYMMEQHPLISGLVILCGIFAGLASCCTLVQIVIVVDK